MSDQREALARLIYDHEKIGRGCISCSERPGAESMSGHQYAEHVAELIAAEFLIVPRKDIEGVEYGWRKYPEHPEIPILAADSLEVARRLADTRGDVWERPALPWTPTPDGGER